MGGLRNAEREGTPAERSHSVPPRSRKSKHVRRSPAAADPDKVASFLELLSSRPSSPGALLPASGGRFLPNRAAELWEADAASLEVGYQPGASPHSRYRTEWCAFH